LDPFLPDGRGGAAAGHGKGVPPQGAGGSQLTAPQKFYNDCIGKMAVEPPNSVSFRFGTAGNAFAKSTSTIIKKPCTGPCKR
jgi:hypothetical protein